MPSTINNKIVSAEKLGIRWIETRTDLEKKIYKQLVGITHEIIGEAFSNSLTRRSYAKYLLFGSCAKRLQIWG